MCLESIGAVIVVRFRKEEKAIVLIAVLKWICSGQVLFRSARQSLLEIKCNKNMDWRMKNMTVRELIEALNKVENKDLEVIMDTDYGYDSIGSVDDVIDKDEWTAKDGSKVYYVRLITCG
jgi:hypothetical protein